ncbi:MAG: hypothetical protein ACE5JE_06690 [Thermoplasmata archaeon]
MKTTSRVRGPAGTKTVGAAGSRGGRLLAFLSVLVTSGRGRRRGVVTHLPPQATHPVNVSYPIPGGYNMGSLLR